MQTPVYPGDKAASEILHRADCHYTVEELKALMAGVLLGCSVVQPSVVLEHIEFGAIDQPHFGDKKLAEDFLSVFFGIWNVTLNHRDPSKPFSFSRPNASWAADDAARWLKFADSREREMGEFLIGLGLSDTPTLADLGDMEDKGTANYLPNLIAKHLGKLEKESRRLQKQKTQNVSSLIRIIEAIDDDLKNHYRAFVEKMRTIEVEPSEVTKTIMRAGPKIGRNDPCSCGSGKKFKQCCLQ